MISNSEIIKQLKKLKSIKPDSDYASVSKSIIMSTEKDAFFEFSTKNKHIKTSIKNLASVNKLNPSNEYWANSRSAILNHPRTIKEKIGRAIMPKAPIKQGFYALSATMAVVLLAVVFSGTNGEQTPGSIIRIESDRITLESENAIKDIDSYIERAGYFTISEQKTKLALDEASSSGPGHLNPTIIEMEARKVAPHNPSNPEIDSLLEKATL